MPHAVPIPWLCAAVPPPSSRMPRWGVVVVCGVRDSASSEAPLSRRCACARARAQNTFFRWTDRPPCHACGRESVQLLSTQPPTDEERRHLASRWVRGALHCSLSPDEETRDTWHPGVCECALLLPPPSPDEAKRHRASRPHQTALRPQGPSHNALAAV
eukprot:290457-Chlamydomonas_euryale.AAC.1